MTRLIREHNNIGTNALKESLDLFKRVIIVLIDSVGIGALPDAAEYGDAEANTLGNIARLQGGLFLPSLEEMGLGLIAPLAGVNPPAKPIGWFGKMAEVSNGKDTTTGHWEMAGCPLYQPLPLYPHGFPEDVVRKITEVIGRPILGNKAASGTEIIAELGAEHMKTGKPIVYTSADSVLQIAAHEEIIPLQELYAMGKDVRERVCVGEHSVGRVIMRPFVGEPGSFKRTANRHDYSLQPPSLTVLDHLKASGREVIGIGKIADIFADRGITKTYPTKSNDHGMRVLLQLMCQSKQEGLIFINLVEFDSVYGHRNDVDGYARALQRFDAQLSIVLATLDDSDLLIVTADHGCDPTVAGTDHTREYVPLLVYYKGCHGGNIGVRESFADVGATIAEIFSLPRLSIGRSFLDEIRGV